METSPEKPPIETDGPKKNQFLFLKGFLVALVAIAVFAASHFSLLFLFTMLVLLLGKSSPIAQVSPTTMLWVVGAIALLATYGISRGVWLILTGRPKEPI